MDAIEQGADLNHRSVNGVVEFEVSVHKALKGKGGIKLYVLSGNTELGSERVASVRFNVTPKSSKDHLSGVVRPGKIL